MSVIKRSPVAGNGEVGDVDSVFGRTGAVVAANGDYTVGQVTGAEATANKDATGGYAGLTLFKINFKNAANTFTSFFTNSNSAARTYTFQDRNGTIADDTDLALYAPLASPTFTGTVKGISIPFSYAISDETTAITTGTKLTFRIPYACTITTVRASLTTASSSGLPTFDILKNGSTIFTTKLTIDANETTSTTAATPFAFNASPLNFADDDLVAIAIDVAGTNAAGAKITMYLTRI
jgi:hypothetical protein